MGIVDTLNGNIISFLQNHIPNNNKEINVNIRSIFLGVSRSI